MDAFTPMNVLLIEDDLADIYLVQRAAADCSVQIRLSVVSSGNEALPFLRKDPPFGSVPSPALILLDLALPRKDGSTILRELRRLPEYQSTPVIILSQTHKEAAEPRCRELGATAYVQKISDFYRYFGSIKAIFQGYMQNPPTLGS